ncbi:hypothetical protein VNO77_00342 [Canavalia gladiata]|uniref:Uncharacterized protein n=1 Tax=Canavalia gladiata TaxID=3824 RepID=A0AAN9R191_CANGL
MLAVVNCQYISFKKHPCKDWQFDRRSLGNKHSTFTIGEWYPTPPPSPHPSRAKIKSIPVLWDLHPRPQLGAFLIQLLESPSHIYFTILAELEGRVLKNKKQLLFLIAKVYPAFHSGAGGEWLNVEAFIADSTNCKSNHDMGSTEMSTFPYILHRRIALLDQRINGFPTSDITSFSTLVCFIFLNI